MNMIRIVLKVEITCSHPEGTSIGSDNCDLLKVCDLNRGL